jgi:hypothetical protein
MLFVRKPAAYSQGDSIIPGRVADDVGFIDTGNELDGVRGPIRVYLSVAGLRQIAQKFPQVCLTDAAASRETIETLQGLLAEAHSDLEQAVLRADRAEAQLSAIAGLKRDGFSVSKIKGPRPQKETV